MLGLLVGCLGLVFRMCQLGFLTSLVCQIRVLLLGRRLLGGLCLVCRLGVCLIVR